jgi:hypothetical protein
LNSTHFGFISSTFHLFIPLFCHSNRAEELEFERLETPEVSRYRSKILGFVCRPFHPSSESSGKESTWG